MAADEAIFDHGEYTAEDYVASADIAGGEVVLLGNTTGLTCGIAHHPIANGATGSLAIGGGVYKGINLNNAANYTKIYWDNSVNKYTTVSTNNALFGYITRGGGGWCQHQLLRSAFAACLMSTLLERAARMLKSTLDVETGISVDIYDGNEHADGVVAIPGQSEFAQYDLDEQVGTAKTFDWCVSAEDLVFSGQKREPKTGWEIWQLLEDGPNEGKHAVYKVVAEPGTRCFDVMDQLGILLRIHTKLDRFE